MQKVNWTCTRASVSTGPSVVGHFLCVSRKLNSLEVKSPMRLFSVVLVVIRVTDELDQWYQNRGHLRPA